MRETMNWKLHATLRTQQSPEDKVSSHSFYLAGIKPVKFLTSF